MSEIINDTDIEDEHQVEESTTEDANQEETVETYSEELDKADTEEEAIAAFKNIDEPEEKPEDTEEAVEESVDTEPESEPSTNYINIKDGDIELQLNLNDEKEHKRAVMLMQQGLNYAGKTTELAKHRSFVQYAEENGISLQDIQQMAAAKSGDKQALSNLAKQGEVDVFDLDNDMADDYKPEPVQLAPQSDPRIDVTANQILSNDTYRESFQKWFPTMPQDIQDAVTSNPDVLLGVQQDLEAGVFDKAMEQAYKYQRIDGMDFGSAYTRSKNELAVIQGEAPSAPPVSRGERVRASGSRPTATTTNRGGYSEGVISDMSDDDFMKNYRDIITSVQAQRN